MDRERINNFKTPARSEEMDLRNLFDLYYKELCIFSLKYVGSFEKAEDVVQEVFINFWENKRAANVKGSIRSYLFTAVRNNSLNFLRKNNRYHFEEIDSYVGELLEEHPDIEALERKKVKLYIELDKLSPKSRKVFDAVVFGNMKYKEAAEDMGISVNTIKTYLSRAMKQLRKSMICFFLFQL